MRILKDNEREADILQKHIERIGQGGKSLKILEAGCGRKWYFRMDGLKYELTGVDLDAAAMEARLKQKGDLHKAIVGDLRTVELEPNSFDVIYNAYVLEHIPGAEQVLDNFLRWLKPGGILILTIPDRDSVHGLMTRMLPFYLHVLYYRWVWKLKEAGKPGFAPYPTFYDKVVSGRGMRAYADKRKLLVREELGFGSYRRGNSPFFRALTPVFASSVSLLTFGRFKSSHVDLAYVLEKPA
jgi:SAM-dependent methyltransferase